MVANGCRTHVTHTTYNLCAVSACDNEHSIKLALAKFWKSVMEEVDNNESTAGADASVKVQSLK